MNQQAAGIGWNPNPPESSYDMTTGSGQLCPSNENVNMVTGFPRATTNFRPVTDPCVRCSFGGADVRVVPCGCVFHTRCLILPPDGSCLYNCPQCSNKTTGLSLIPMSFREIDDAKKTAQHVAAQYGGGKRKRRSIVMGATDESVASVVGSTVEKTGGVEESDQRTGRWTTAETAYVDELICKFENGVLPLSDGIKLNDFLAGMLQCKQSRLTKKMKNAKLSSKSFKRTHGYIERHEDARDFSSLEEAFFLSIHCGEERAEMKFHMQKQWRELFISYCVNLGQALDADAWLNSVEEIERRASMARDAARMVRRKLMMGKALNQDSRNPDSGVIIDQSGCDFGGTSSDSVIGSSAAQHDLSVMNRMLASGNPGASSALLAGNSNINKNVSPYLEKIIRYLERGGIPFEHVDAWVPSYVSTADGDNMASSSAPQQSKCRLCFGGFATMELNSQVRRTGQGGRSTGSIGGGAIGSASCTGLLSAEEHFNLVSFGEYSQKFSFDIGCGLPGRVYSSGIPTWEQSVHNAPLEHFERCGGAIQCGIKTVVGIPVPSPNVGRIVIVLYSCHDREKDQELVGRLAEEFTRLAPTPRWKLIVDIGAVEPSSVLEGSTAKDTPGTESNGLDLSYSGHTGTTNQQKDAGVKGKDPRIDAVVSLLGEYMPADSSPHSVYLPGFMTLRLMMLRPSHSERERELMKTMLDSYESYAKARRNPEDIAVLLARDCIFLTNQQRSQPLLNASTHSTTVQPMMTTQNQPQHMMVRQPQQAVASEQASLQNGAMTVQDHSIHSTTSNMKNNPTLYVQRQPVGPHIGVVPFHQGNLQQHKSSADLQSMPFQANTNAFVNSNGPAGQIVHGNFQNTSQSQSGMRVALDASSHSNFSSTMQAQQQHPQHLQQNHMNRNQLQQQHQFQHQNQRNPSDRQLSNGDMKAEHDSLRKQHRNQQQEQLQFQHQTQHPSQHQLTNGDIKGEQQQHQQQQQQHLQQNQLHRSQQQQQHQFHHQSQHQSQHQQHQAVQAQARHLSSHLKQSQQPSFSSLGPTPTANGGPSRDLLPKHDMKSEQNSVC